MHAISCIIPLLYAEGKPAMTALLWHVLSALRDRIVDRAFRSGDDDDRRGGANGEVQDGPHAAELLSEAHLLLRSVTLYP